MPLHVSSTVVLIIFFFFFQLYNSLWVLACSIISFHFYLSCVLCFQLFTPIFLKPFLTSSSHLTLGLPFGLVAYGFHLYMVLATLSLVILSTYPNKLNCLYFMYLTIFSLLPVLPVLHLFWVSILWLSSVLGQISFSISSFRIPIISA